MIQMSETAQFTETRKLLTALTNPPTAKDCQQMSGCDSVLVGFFYAATPILLPMMLLWDIYQWVRTVATQSTTTSDSETNA